MSAKISRVMRVVSVVEYPGGTWVYTLNQKVTQGFNTSALSDVVSINSKSGMLWKVGDRVKVEVG